MKKKLTESQKLLLQERKTRVNEALGVVQMARNQLQFAVNVVAGEHGILEGENWQLSEDCSELIRVEGENGAPS